MLWDDGRRYAIEVDVSMYPAHLRTMFRSFRGTWEVTPRADGGSTLRIGFEGDVRGGRLGASIVGRMAARARQDLEDTLDGYVGTARTAV